VTETLFDAPGVWTPDPAEPSHLSVIDCRAQSYVTRSQYWKRFGVALDATGRDHVATVAGAGWGTGWSASSQITSTFNPALAEVLVSWYSNPGGMVIDPFCGGPVRGVVAAMMGRRYHGADIRPEQIQANQTETEKLPPTDHLPTYEHADSLRSRWPAAQMVFTSPPYHDLEIYSDDPLDLSTMTWPNYLRALSASFQYTAAALTPGGFAVWVIADIPGRPLVAELTKIGDSSPLVDYHETLTIVHRVGTAGWRAAVNYPRTGRATRVHSSAVVFKAVEP
jgi:hypothetical protein